MIIIISNKISDHKNVKQKQLSNGRSLCKEGSVFPVYNSWIKWWLDKDLESTELEDRFGKIKGNWRGQQT